MVNQANNRVVFIDQARALAITLMILGHSMDRFLGEPWCSGAAWQNYQFFRGISSALFLCVSGFSFVVASFNRFDDYTGWSPRLSARLKRILFVLFLGYLLQLSGPTLFAVLGQTERSSWEQLFKFDVLQNIGFGLALLQLTVLVSQKREHFARNVAVLIVGVFALAWVTYRPEVDRLLPLNLASAANLYHRSRFPMVPYTGYLLLGAFWGYHFWVARQHGRELRVFAALGMFSAALIGVDLAIHGDPRFFPYGGHLPSTPGYTFARAGCALLAISGLYLLSRRVVVLPRLALLLSKESLSIYFVHLLLIYGGSFVPGLFAGYAHSLHPAMVWLWIACLYGTMIAMAWSLSAARQKHPHQLATARTIFVTTTILCFTVLPYQTHSLRVAIALVSTAAVLMAQRRRQQAKAAS